MPNDSLPPVSRILALVIRHGQTAFNDPKNPRLRAWEEIPLTDEGRANVQITANKIKIYSPKIIYSSDLGRDSETAMMIAELLGNIPYETDFALRTANMGTLSGLPEKQAHERVERWYDNPTEPAPSGESLHAYEKRTWKFIGPKVDLAREVPSFRPTAFVTHGRTIALLDSYYNIKRAKDALMPVPAGVAVIRSNVNGMDSLEFLGETEPVQTDA
jgi:broad specificity phosphatase PhoE